MVAVFFVLRELVHKVLVDEIAFFDVVKCNCIIWCKGKYLLFFLNRKQLWKRALDCCSQSGHNRSIGTYKTVNVVIIDNKSLAALGRGEVKKYTGGEMFFHVNRMRYSITIEYIYICWYWCGNWTFSTHLTTR